MLCPRVGVAGRHHNQGSHHGVYAEIEQADRTTNKQVAQHGRYAFMPAGATCDDFSPMASSARRTSPDAFASSMNSVT